MATKKIAIKLFPMKSWIKLSRPEFHTVGVLPVLLGAVLGYSVSGTFSVLAVGLALLATVLIMLATYWTGEVFDYEVDTLSAQLEKNKFSGGTLVLQQTGIPRDKVLKGAIIAIIAAFFIGAYMAWGMGYGTSLFLVGVLGALMGFFYSTPPFQWAYRGIGETFIAIAYGWLPVAVGYYLHTRSWDLIPILIFGTPIAISIFMVILINEFPDYPADRQVGKKNLVVRLGRERAAVLYIIAGILFILSVILPIFFGYREFYFAIPGALLALANVIDMARGRWRDRNYLEQLCARTIILNTGTTLLLILGILFM